jgi:hypothetical protein
VKHAEQHTSTTPPTPNSGKRRRCPACRVTQDAAAFVSLAPVAGADWQAGVRIARAPGWFSG